MYEGFYNLIWIQLFNNGSYISDMVFHIGGVGIQGDEYLACLMAIVCTVIVYVVCCLCVWKVIRLFGRLWSRF